MSMSQKDYELLALSLRETRAAIVEGLRETAHPADAVIAAGTLDAVVTNLVKHLRADNERFQPAKFTRAAGCGS